MFFSNRLLLLLLLNKKKKKKMSLFFIYRDLFIACVTHDPPHYFPFFLVPMVLKCCAEFIEEYGIVDGIYRLSGITSNIQKLRWIVVNCVWLPIWAPHVWHQSGLLVPLWLPRNLPIWFGEKGRAFFSKKLFVKKKKTSSIKNLFFSFRHADDPIACLWCKSLLLCPAKKK